jgi:O-antigen/teichoic acid export membrane protein
VTLEENLTSAETAVIPNSTAGMTTKVVKGSLWTLVGQVLPLGVSLVTTPFVIRLLGAESYGVLILVGLLPTYLGFADLGMGLASTKFASEAYAEGDPAREARIVRTAALIAFCCSVPIATTLIVLSSEIISIFNVPEHLHSEASIALKLTAITFVINLLNSIFNTPELARLRMDLNTLVTAGFRIFGLILLPFAIYQGGIVSGVLVLLVASILTLAGHLFISAKLTRHILGTGIEGTSVKPLLRVGGAFALAGIAAVLLANSEKLILTKVASVQSLAYYSVAFTFANMTTMFSGAMAQSLIPAFSQLLSIEKRSQLEALFARCLRLNIYGLLPIIAVLFVIARPFFSLWAGPDFGTNSSPPFYILVIGLYFNLNGYVAGSLLMASGRTDLYAKAFWIQLAPYLLLTFVLTSYFGIIGAALAWSLRVVLETFAFNWMAKSVASLHLGVHGRIRNFLVALGLTLPPIAATVLVGDKVILLFSILLLSVLLYAVFTWRILLENDEKIWINNKIIGILQNWRYASGRT